MKIGVFGCGYMTQSIFQGVSSFPKDYQFSFYTPGKTRAEEMASTYGGQVIPIAENTLGKNRLEEFDCIFLGFKPQNLADFKADFGMVGPNTLVVSILAAVPRDSIAEMLGSEKVVRLMPSRPIEKKLGITLEYWSHSENSQGKESGGDLFNEQDRRFIETLLQDSSLRIPLASESDFDQLTVVTGSGPGFLFKLAKDVASYLKSEFGLSDKFADQISAQLFVGSSELMKPVRNRDEADFSGLVQSVASKKGVTQAGLDVMEETSEKFLASIFQAGRERVDEMTRELGFKK